MTREQAIYVLWCMAVACNNDQANKEVQHDIAMEIERNFPGILKQHYLTYLAKPTVVVPPGTP